MAEVASSDDDHGWLMEIALLIYDLLSAVAIVGLVVGFVFAISGVWPMLVAIESPSMDPHIKKGDLAFVMEEHRFPAEGATPDTGVTPYQAAERTGYSSFQRPGDVIVFQPNGNADKTPIIHRARFYVEEGDNWVERANDSWLSGIDSCEDTSTCPAPHDGFITGGDNNGHYDQTNPQQLTTIVKPEWVVGRALGRIPYLGKIRLQANAMSRDITQSSIAI